MSIPKPDRSNSPPNLTPTAENPVLDLGWNEGIFADLRPYRVELWTKNKVLTLTFFMSTIGIENCSDTQFADLLEREQLIACRPGASRLVFAMPLTDASGNSVWSVSVLIGAVEAPLADVLVATRPYRTALAGATLHIPPNTDETWRELANAIASCLPALEEDEFLIISHKRANYFVQFAAQGSFGVRVEATCNAFIDPNDVLTDEQYAVMAQLGWQRATERLLESGAPQDPDGSPNFFLSLPNPVNRAALGQLTVATFRTVYGVLHPGELQYRAFGDGGASIRFPTMGLKRERA